MLAVCLSLDTKLWLLDVDENLRCAGWKQALTFGHMSAQQWMNVARCSMELFKVRHTTFQ
jgi:hypothetical protein